jgi:hypothetical protein
LIHWKALGHRNCDCAVLIIAAIVGLIFLIAWLTHGMGRCAADHCCAALVIVAIVAGIIYNEIVW